MMKLVQDKDYYQILGVSSGADQKEIKRAYFKLVRQFTPEKDPERFQQIREAYENLSDPGKDVKAGLHLEFPDHPIAEDMRQQAEQALARHDFQEAAHIAENAMMHFGECQGFLYCLGIAQNAMGKSGLAVRTFEDMVKKWPEEKAFRQELAMAYMNRGYGRKAYDAFEKAFEMGCRNMDFLMSFVMCCTERNRRRRSIEIMECAAAEGMKHPKECTEELIYIFTGQLLVISKTGLETENGKKEKQEKLREVLRNLQDFLRKAGQYCGGESLYLLFSSVFGSVSALELTGSSEFQALYREMDRVGGEDPVWKEIKEQGTCMDEMLRIARDDEMPDTLKMGFEAFVYKGMGWDAYDEEDEYAGDEEIRRIMLLDAKLCILEEWPGIRPDIERIKREYPLYYEAIREFAEQLEKTGSIDRLRDKLIKDYDRLKEYIDGGFYYEKYPHRQVRKSASTWDSWEEGTYVRQGPKIGRNDPCPCGSGKKYKNCCGRVRS